MLIVVSFTACVSSLFLFTPELLSQTRPKDELKRAHIIRATVEVAGRVADVKGDHAAKFKEVRDVSKGLLVPKFKLDVTSPDSPYFLTIKGLEIRERDQRFTVKAGKFGKHRTQFMWDQVTHSFGFGKSFLVRTAPGLYQVSPTLRAQLQARTTPEARIAPNSVVSNLVRQELAVAPTTEARLRRDQALLKHTYQPNQNVELHFQFRWLRNRGTRPMSAGTFVRRAVPAGGLPDIGGAWEGIGQEFLEPIDTRTIDFKAGARFGGKRWSAGVDYSLSLFRNRIGDVTFENPFRVTDDQGCTVVAGNLVCASSNRFRQVHWQSDLPPNNNAHTITFWARANLTPRTQARGLFSLSYWTQNDDFLPWTLNTAIVPRNWDRRSPVTNPTDLNELPAQSLNGKMRNINQEYALVNRSETFRFHAQYRSQSLDTQSPPIVFPGYAAFGDSTWRSAVTDFYNLPIENLDWDFRRQNIEAGFHWDVLRQLSWKVDYEWEVWNRKFRDVNRSNEHSIRNRLEFEQNIAGGPRTVTATANAPRQPLTTLRLRLDYRYANRQPLVYNTQPLFFNANLPGSPAGGPTAAWEVLRSTVMKVGVPMEFNLLRRFDQAARARNDATVTVEFLKGPKTSFSASYRYLGDEYDKDFYGLLYNRSAFVDAQFSQTFDFGAFLYANYSRQLNRFAYRDLAHLLPNPPAPPGAINQGSLAQFATANTWERTSRNSLDSFEFGINVAPEEGMFKVWQFDLSYALSYMRDRITTLNPFPVRPDSVLHAGAHPYPDTIVRSQDLNIAVTRRINENFEIGARYWFEPFKLDDFSYNLLAPYVHGSVTSDTPKFLFQDARYGSYHSNVVTFFLRRSF